MSKNIISLLFLGTLTLVSGVDFTSVSATDLQKMSTKERVKYINDFKEEIALMSMDDRHAALEKMRIKMRLQHLPGQPKEYVQQMQNATSGDMNLMQNMFQQQLQKISQTTINRSQQITEAKPPLSLPF